MAPARAIPRLLARNKLKAMDIALWEIHEAFAAQVLANIKEARNPDYVRTKAKLDYDHRSVPVGSRQSQWRLDVASAIRLPRPARAS